MSGSTLFVGATVFTGRSERDTATAFRVGDGVVTWIGDAGEVDGQPAVDLGGRTVVPGFLDMHTHPALMALRVGSVDCLPPAVTSIAELVDRLRTHPDLGGPPDSWIVGTGLDDSRFPGSRAPVAADLDAVSTTQPVLVWRCDEHSGCCNTRALEVAGITAATPDPPGARFERDATGRPTGVLTEMAAMHAVGDHVPGVDAAGYAARIAALGDHFVSHGITAVCDLLSTAVPDPLATFRLAREQGFRPRVALFPAWRPDTADLADGDREGPVRVAGVKVFLDGAFSNRTAWVEQTYPASHDHGMQTLSDDALAAAADYARRNAVQLAVHAMGDRAIARLVDVLGDREPWLTDGPSVRIEHTTLVPSDLLERLVAAPVRFGISTHAVFLFAETAAYHRNLAPDQAAAAYPLRSLYASGLPLALSSDRPSTAWADADDVLLSVQAAATRIAHDGSGFGEEQTITVPQALLLYTGRARHVTRLGAVGVLEPGAAADFVVLSRDILSLPLDEVAAVQVAETWMAGERVFDACSSIR